MTTDQVKIPPSEVRRINRKRRERRRLRAATHEVIPQEKVTFEDLDVDQMVTYEGIHEWWRVQKSLGGTARPLTIGGYAGTGKSTLLGIALPALRNPDRTSVDVKYCAFTGKAASVLITKGMNASTIHSLIYNCVPDPDSSDKYIFELKFPEEIGAELIVVDEGSMVPDEMRRDLESLGIPIIYTGDHGQLPPVVGKGNVMENPRFKLEEPHRQALDSGIILMATNVRKGLVIEKGVMGLNSDAKKIGTAARMDTELLSSVDMVICYKNDTREKLNRRIRGFRGFTDKYPEKGEKIICVKNNKVTGMFNGLVLIVVSSEMDGDMLLMDCVDESGTLYRGLRGYTNYFDNKEHPKIKGSTINNVFEFAYAITGHKSQGSQWGSVIVIEEIMYKQTTDIKRRWLYTTLTRAVDSLIWISRFH